MKKRTTRRRFLICFITVMLSISICAAITAQSDKKEIPKKILFIGNSITTYGAGLDYILKELAASASPTKIITADRATADSTALEGLWLGSRNRHERILAGGYDVVVLQATLSKTGKVYGGNPSDTEAKFHEYAAKFDDEIRKGGAKTLLFMHWQFNEPEAIAIQEIARIYKDVSARLNAEVAPAGLAWDRVQKSHPKMVFLSDSVHPTIKGSYLSACVLYATIFRESPVGLPYIAKEMSAITGGLSRKEARILQRGAWDAVKNYVKTYPAEGYSE